MTSVSTDRRFGINSGAAVKVPCRCATTAAITLNGLQTIDGIALAADDRVLVKNQASSIANGIYSASTGNWSRAPDFDGKFDVKSGTLVLVNGGTANGSRSWRLTTADPVTIESSALTFVLADIGGGTPLDDAFLTVQRTEASAVATTQHQANQVAVLNVLVFDATIDNTGVADVTTKLQAAINAATGKLVFIPAGTYSTQQITIPSDTKVSGEGAATQIVPKAGFALGSFWVTANAGASIEIGNLSFNVNKASFPAVNVIQGNSASFLRVHDCIINQGGSMGIYLSNSTDCVIDNNQISNCATRPFFCDGASSARHKVTRNKIDATGGVDHGIQFAGGVDHIAAFNTVTGSTKFGINAYGNTFGTARVNISNNVVFNTIAEAINITDANDCTVANNICYWTGSVSQDFGMSIAAQAVASNGHRIFGNYIKNCGKAGIALAATGPTAGANVQLCMISNNQIINPNQTSQVGGTGSGVNIFASATFLAQDNVVQDNYIFDNTAKLVNGVDDAQSLATTANKIINNKVLGQSGVVVNKLAVSIEALTSGWKSFPTVVTSGTGTITTLGTVTFQYYETEKKVNFVLNIAITTNGTAATNIQATLPFVNNATLAAVAIGRENALTGKALQGYIAAGSSSIFIVDTANVYTGGNGSILWISGFYIRA